MKGFNQGIEKYNKLRKFLSILFLYGCYSRDDFNDLGMSPRFYDDELRRVRNLLSYDEKYVEEERQKNKKIVRLNFDYYNTAENYLINSYLNSNLRPNDLFLFLSIIKFLGTEREYSVDDVIDGIEQNYLFFDKMTYYRKLEYLLELGIVEARKEKNVKLYKLQSDFFKDFSEQELKDLYYLTLFFSHVEKPSVPGVFLKENIKRYLKDRLGFSIFKEPFLYRFLQFHQVLEEETVWKLLEAIQGNRMVKIHYQTKKSGIKVYKNLPVKIILDIKYGRWYLIAYNLKHRTFYTYPLHRVEEVEVLNGAIDITKHEIEERYQNFFCNSWLIAGNKNGSKEVKIKFTLDPEITENFLFKMVKRDIINPQIEILNPKEFILTLYVSDIMEIKPWIKGFSYRAEVLPSKEHSLREEIKGEWEEVLSLYENI